MYRTCVGVEALEPALDRTQQLVKDTLENNVLIDDKLWDLQHYLKNFTTGE